MHVVVVVAFDGVVPFDLALPTDLFGRVKLANGEKAYEVMVAGVTPTIDAGAFTIRTQHTLEALDRADTVVIPGVSDPSSPISPKLLRAVVSAASRGARVASICSGAFILAETGLLDGRRATTHWLGATELSERFPDIEVDPNALYVDEGRVLTSAGAAAGFDLCLHMVRKDHGAAVAASAARASVMALEREGGQSQFIRHPPPGAEGASLEPLLRWLDARLHTPLTLDAVARHVAMSVRTLSRRFREQTGTTPLQWLIHARIRRAQHLLETTSQPIESIAAKVGFASPTAFREQFQRFVSTNPRAYRRAFRSKGTSAHGAH